MTETLVIAVEFLIVEPTRIVRPLVFGLLIHTHADHGMLCAAREDNIPPGGLPITIQTCNVLQDAPELFAHRIRM